MAKKVNAKKFDVVIIGGGAAGMSAALWCDELKLNALLLEAGKELGGQLHIVHNPIENHLGIPAKDGKSLNHIFQIQLKKRRFSLCLQAEVKKVNYKTKQIILKDGTAFSSHSIVIATGVKRRKLGVKGEKEFQNKGILESGKRDAEKVKGKTVCIVGGGDAAMENAVILSEYAEKVYLIHHRNKFRARPEFIEKVLNATNVEVLYQTSVVEIIGKNKVEALKLQNSTKSESFILPTDALLLRIGVSPNTEIFKGKLNLDDKDYIEITSNCETNIKDIYAIGDVANQVAPTISSAVGMGATVAKTIFKKLTNNE